jgi:hypothetical protein
LPIEVDSVEEEPEDETSWAHVSSSLSALIKFAEWYSTSSPEELMQLYTF